MEEAWRNLTTTNVFTKPNWPLICCNIRMTIEEDTSAQCYECGRNIWPAVPCATREQFYANGGRRRTPYHRIKYFREWMIHILGHPTFVSKDEMKMNKRKPYQHPPHRTLKKTLKKLKLQKHIKSLSYHLILNHRHRTIPQVSDDNYA